jgi:hypothetical protein
MPPRKRKRSDDAVTADGSVDVRTQPRSSVVDPNDHKDSKHSSGTCAAAAAVASGGDRDDAAAASASSAGDSGRRTRRRTAPPTTVVVTGADYVLDSDDESEVAIAISSLSLYERSVDAPPRTSLPHDAAGAAAGAGAGAGASSAPRAAASSSGASARSAASAAVFYDGHSNDAKDYLEQMERNHAHFAALNAAAAAEREAKAEKKAERKVSARRHCTTSLFITPQH